LPSNDVLAEEVIEHEREGFSFFGDCKSMMSIFQTASRPIDINLISYIISLGRKNRILFRHFERYFKKIEIFPLLALKRGWSIPVSF